MSGFDLGLERLFLLIFRCRSRTNVEKREYRRQTALGSTHARNPQLPDGLLAGAAMVNHMNYASRVELTDKKTWGGSDLSLY